MKLLSTWHTLYKLRYCPVTLIQIAFSAGTVYLLMAMQPNSGTCISLKELRQSLDQETLVEQCLQEMGLSWDCAMKDSDTLRKLKNGQVGPLLDFLDQRSFVNLNADLYISANIDEANKDTFSSLPNSSDVTDFGFFRLNPHHPIHAISSLSTLPKYFLSRSIPANQDSPFSAYAPIPSAPITIRSQGFISEPSSFASPWSLLSSEDASGGQRSSLVHNSQPSGQGSAPKIQPSDQSSAANIQPSSSPSSRNHFVSGYLGMSGGQGFGSVFRWLFQWSSYSVLVSQISSERVRNWLPWSWISLLSLGSISFSRSNNSMDLDSVPWKQSFTSYYPYCLNPIRNQLPQSSILISCSFVLPSSYAAMPTSTLTPCRILLYKNSIGS